MMAVYRTINFIIQAATNAAICSLVAAVLLLVYLIYLSSDHFKKALMPLLAATGAVFLLVTLWEQAGRLFEWLVSR